MSHHKSLCCKTIFYFIFPLHSTTKITATKYFGNSKNNKIVLPLVPEPMETVTQKEDLAMVYLYSDPTDTYSTKVRFSFKTLNGSVESPRELIEWRKNVERAFTGLNSTTGLLQHQMMQQFCRGTALSTCNSNVTADHGVTYRASKRTMS